MNDKQKFLYEYLKETLEEAEVQLTTEEINEVLEALKIKE